MEEGRSQRDSRKRKIGRGKKLRRRKSGKGEKKRGDEGKSMREIKENSVCEVYTKCNT